MKTPGFMRKVEVNTESGCWLYRGYVRPDGYVSGVGWKGRPDYAHRISYRVNVGPIPEGYEVDHLCRVRSCVNPAHLRAVPPRVNVLAGTGPTAINAAKTRCHRGHPFDAENTSHYRGRRVCRTCKREQMAVIRQSRKATQ